MDAPVHSQNTQFTPEMIPNKDIEIYYTKRNGVKVINIRAKYVGPLPVSHADMPSGAPRNKTERTRLALVFYLLFGLILIMTGGLNEALNENPDIAITIPTIIIGCLFCCGGYPIHKIYKELLNEDKETIRFNAKSTIAQRMNLVIQMKSNNNIPQQDQPYMQYVIQQPAHADQFKPNAVVIVNYADDDNISHEQKEVGPDLNNKIAENIQSIDANNVTLC